MKICCPGSTDRVRCEIENTSVDCSIAPGSFAVDVDKMWQVIDLQLSDRIADSSDRAARKKGSAVDRDDPRSDHRSR